MFSIIILYSPDRLEQLNQMIYFLYKLSHIEYCEIIIIVDGINNINNYNNFTILELKRSKKYYCWADAINLGLKKAKFENILYLDSDRILPNQYLNILKNKIEDDCFIFPSFLKQFKKDVDLNTIQNLLYNSNSNLLFDDNRIYSNPIDAIRSKNPMSGCVCFTKKTYYKSGGFDDTFIGWGFPDTDFYMSTYKQNFKFIPIDCVELHLCHKYENVIRENCRSLPRLMGLWNGIKFCKKWEIPIHESILESAKELKIEISSLKNSSLDKFLSRYVNEIKLI